VAGLRSSRRRAGDGCSLARGNLGHLAAAGQRWRS
jgi:hypothetical protein